jgi:hypothetical protein
MKMQSATLISEKLIRLYKEINENNSLEEDVS